jgi:hypothetical protein
MKLVIDINALRTPELEAFLKSSKSNIAVLTDYSAIESYKANNLNTLIESFKIVSNYPSQIEILKGTIDCCGIISFKGENPGQKLIDRDQSRNFHKYYSSLIAAQFGSHNTYGYFKSHSRTAIDQINRMKKDVHYILKSFKEGAKLYNKHQKKMIKEKSYLNCETTISDVAQKVMDLSEEMFLRHPRVDSPPILEDATKTFIFRQALCAHVMLLKWIRNGSPSEIKSKKLLNDEIDTNYATYGLYFDGLMTNDKKLRSLFKESKALLKVLNQEFYGKEARGALKARFN